MLRFRLSYQISYFDWCHSFNDIGQQQPIAAIILQVGDPLFRLNSFEIVIGPVGVHLKIKSEQMNSVFIYFTTRKHTIEMLHMSSDKIIAAKNFNWIVKHSLASVYLSSDGKSFYFRCGSDV